MLSKRSQKNQVTFVPSEIYFHFRSEMCNIGMDDDYKVDYIYCLSYVFPNTVKINFKTLEVTDTTVECNLTHRQRSSQQILDLADYLQMHSDSIRSIHPPTRRYESSKSFCSDTPIWIELTNHKSFFEYFRDRYNCNDVMLIWSGLSPPPSNLNEIEEFCKVKRWRCAERVKVRGSEVSVTILYDFGGFVNFEYLTRAKHQLVIVTIAGKQRYFLSFQVVLLS